MPLFLVLKYSLSLTNFHIYDTFPCDESQYGEAFIVSTCKILIKTGFSFQASQRTLTLKPFIFILSSFLISFSYVTFAAAKMAIS